MTHAPDFPPTDPGYYTELERHFQAVPIIRALGVEADELARGLCMRPRRGPETA